VLEAAGKPFVVTGSRGRLGRALLATSARPIHGWDRPLLDLDDPASATRLVERDAPALVFHAAAMTDVDEAARDSERAFRRNAEATEALAHACREAGAGLLLISTNEVFDGQRRDGQGYREDDVTAPVNAYGRSKLAAERAALAAYAGAEGLWIVRTAWLFGPPGGDFPDKISAAADRVAPAPLPVVIDEVGSPTYTLDLARAIHALVARTRGGTYHLVNFGHASRFDWAGAVLDARRPGRELRAITRAEYERPSVPPAWGVLDTSRAAAVGVELRPWSAALAEYLAEHPATAGRGATG
jgi:dTDP-4-dehydrorhamnose reductase